jgi:hypothetical protein
MACCLIVVSVSVHLRVVLTERETFGLLLLLLLDAA